MLLILFVQAPVTSQSQHFQLEMVRIPFEYTVADKVERILLNRNKKRCCGAVGCTSLNAWPECIYQMLDNYN